MKYVYHWTNSKGIVLQFHEDGAICDSFETFETEELFQKFLTEKGMVIEEKKDDEDETHS